MIAPLQVTAAGNYLTNYGGWSGNANPAAAGTLATTCNDWTNKTSAAHATSGRVLFGKISKALGFDPSLGCDAMFNYLYCLQP